MRKMSRQRNNRGIGVEVILGILAIVATMVMAIVGSVCDANADKEMARMENELATRQMDINNDLARREQDWQREQDLLAHEDALRNGGKAEDKPGDETGDEDGNKEEGEGKDDPAVDPEGDENSEESAEPKEEDPTLDDEEQQKAEDEDTSTEDASDTGATEGEQAD